jgi:predicted RNA-binding Zn-ribbon protein involved in translation (DUF1610 family)
MMEHGSDTHPAASEARKARAQSASRCPSCGGEIPTAGEGGAARSCPHCGARQVAEDRHPSTVIYEDKTVVCLPYELERAARAEAVDGWHLLDTTVSEAVPGMIEARFRRPVQLAPPSRGEPEPPRGRGSREQRPERPAPRQNRRPAASQPSRNAGRARHSSGPQHLLFYILLAVGVIWAADNIGWVGILLAFWLLPPMLRSVLGTGRRRRSKRRTGRRR